MTSKNELNRCKHCARYNWHENTHCSWCARPLPRPNPEHHSWTTVLMVLVALCSLISVGYVLWNL